MIWEVCDAPQELEEFPMQICFYIQKVLEVLHRRLSSWNLQDPEMFPENRKESL